MFDFLSKRNRQLSSKNQQSSKASPRLQKRSLFLESLEDRRLLAQDITLSNLEIVSGGSSTTVNSGDALNIAEGDILRFTGLTVDDGVSADENIEVLLQLTGPSANASNPINSDFSVDIAGSDFNGESIVSNQVYVGIANIPQTDPGGTSLTFEVVVTNDLVVELDDDFNVQIFKTVGANPQDSFYAVEPTLTLADNDGATVSVAANDSAAAEAGVDPGQFTVT